MTLPKIHHFSAIPKERQFWELLPEIPKTHIWAYTRSRPGLSDGSITRVMMNGRSKALPQAIRAAVPGSRLWNHWTILGDGLYEVSTVHNPKRGETPVHGSIYRIVVSGGKVTNRWYTEEVPWALWDMVRDIDLLNPTPYLRRVPGGSPVDSYPHPLVIALSPTWYGGFPVKPRAVSSRNFHLTERGEQNTWKILRNGILLCSFRSPSQPIAISVLYNMKSIDERSRWSFPVRIHDANPLWTKISDDTIPILTEVFLDHNMVRDTDWWIG